MVLGASGQIGRLVVAALARAGVPVRAVGRAGGDGGGEGDQAPGVERHTLSAYDGPGLTEALDGCAAVVATLGMPYRATTWAEQWPPLLAAVARAAHTSGAPLTVLDNLYVYGRANGAVTEQSPLAPCSRKGRARLAGWCEVRRAQEAGADVVVARSADFLGPGAQSSILPWHDVVACARGRRGALPWLGDPDARHSFAWTPELAAALARIALQPALRASPVLHLPALRPTTGRQVATALGGLRGRPVRLRPLRSAAVTVAALVSGRAREQREMMYQVESDYVLDDGLVRRLGWTTPQLCVEDVLLHALGEGSGAPTR
ncbi:nucleoside-diphosphate-sugar epimerase [Xylanimonas ulmi]|uniref:Nucleoside-diphosphate-sugar epimerase n=1 Tax=Xylanimonas ulmi TaxID=228973 RepID=A0A4Q7M4H3_9MICO|nr:nucleoside-diphosphate-sugar epimerase [Xylanibacterium ulmi]